MDKKEKFYQDWTRVSPPYGRGVLDVYHKPYLISKEEEIFFAQVVETFHTIIEKITMLFIQGQFREILKFSPRLYDLILADPGYSMASPFCRWDSFYFSNRLNESSGEHALKFLELNTDGTSAMTYVEALDDLFLETFGEWRGWTPCHLKEKVLGTLLGCYKGFRWKKEEKPQIAIIGWPSLPTRPEHMVLCDFFNQSGYSTVWADPRTLTYDGTCLWKDGFRIDLIYRRVVTTEYLRFWDDVKDLTQAYLDGNVCLAGSFRSQIGFDKRTFAILSSPEFNLLFTPEENRMNQFCIPWTRVLEDQYTTFREQEIPLLEFVLKNKDQWILKPPDANRGRGVVFGSQIDQSQWEQEIKNKIGTGYIVQEQVPMPLWGDHQWGLHLGHFVFGGKLAGWMCRAGKDQILSDRSDDRLLPCLAMTS